MSVMWLPAWSNNTHIEAVIIFEHEFELRGEVAERAGHETEQDRSGCGHHVN